MSELLLESGLARATIHPERGALIADLKLIGRNGKAEPILWLPEGFSQSPIEAWPGGGLPFLFPFAGRVWHNNEVLKYSVSGNVYDMPIHGFAWGKAWNVIAKTQTTVRLSLKSDDHSKKHNYPFDFEAVMTITLSARALQIAVDITHKTLAAKTREKMPVAIGWHPYFKIGENPQLSIHADTIYPVTSVGNAGDPQSIRDYLDPSPWKLPSNALGSLILGDLTGEASRIDLGSSSLLISAGPEDVMQHVVTWTNQPKEFFCVEPWMSLPDAVARPTGCRWLKPGESLSAWLNIECR